MNKLSVSLTEKFLLLYFLQAEIFISRSLIYLSLSGLVMQEDFSEKLYDPRFK